MSLIHISHSHPTPPATGVIQVVARALPGVVLSKDRARLSVCVALASAIAAFSPGGAWAAEASTPLNDVGLFTTILVDDANGRVFVSGTDRTAVLDFDGNRIGTLPAGGDGLVLDPDSPTLHVAIGGARSVSSFNRLSLDFLTSFVVFPAVPLDIVLSHGRFWFADGCGLAEVGLASVERDGSELRRYAGDDFPRGCGRLVGMPGSPDQLLMADTHFSPPPLFRYEIVDDVPILRARNSEAGPPGSRLAALAVTPDGTKLITAGSPTSLQSFDATDLSPAGPTYAMEGWSTAVAVSADGSLVAGGRDAPSSSRDVLVFARQSAALGRTYDLGEHMYVAPRGLAFSGDRSRLFAVGTGAAGLTFFVLPNPGLRATSLSLSSSPDPVPIGGTVTISGRLSDLNGSGAGGRLIEILSKAPNGALEFRANTTTDSDGHFTYPDPLPLVEAGGTYVYEARFSGDATFTASTQSREIQVAKRTTTLALQSSHRRTPYDRSVTLRARLTGPASGVVSIFARPHGQARTLVKRGSVDAGGVLAASYRMKRKTVFTAEYAGDLMHMGSTASRGVEVRALINIALAGQYGKSGKYALFRVGNDPKVTASVVPSHADQRVKFIAQKLISGSWRTTGTARFPIRADGSAVAFLNAVGGTYRVRVSFGGDADHLGATSRWRYLKAL